jgi:RNA polymerase sigma factor (sigma-70 family)
MATLLHRHSDHAFEGLYRAHAADVYRYALALTGNPADAEDVAQTTFMNAYRALARGERPQKPRNWLIAITHNVCRQRFRQASRRPAEVEFEEDVAEAVVPSDEAPTGADIQRALGHLALNQRAALVMRELEGRSYAEIAEMLGLSVAAVETLIFRARRALREQLEGSLTCSQAEAALSLQMDGQLPRSEAGQLRAHLRECDACRHLARSQRAQRKGFKALAAVPLPPSLASAFGGGATTATTGLLGGGLLAKAAAVTAAAAVLGGGSYAVVKHASAPPSRHARPPAAAAAASTRLRPVRASHPPPTRPAAAAHARHGFQPAVSTRHTRPSLPSGAAAHSRLSHASPAHPVHPVQATAHKATTVNRGHTHTKPAGTRKAGQTTSHTTHRHKRVHHVKRSPSRNPCTASTVTTTTTPTSTTPACAKGAAGGKPQTRP